MAKVFLWKIRYFLCMFFPAPIIFAQNSDALKARVFMRESSLQRSKVLSVNICAERDQNRRVRCHVCWGWSIWSRGTYRVSLNMSLISFCWCKWTDNEAFIEENLEKSEVFGFSIGSIWEKRNFVHFIGYIGKWEDFFLFNRGKWGREAILCRFHRIGKTSEFFLPKWEEEKKILRQWKKMMRKRFIRTNRKWRDRKKRNWKYFSFPLKEYEKCPRKPSLLPNIRKNRFSFRPKYKKVTQKSLP